MFSCPPPKDQIVDSSRTGFFSDLPVHLAKGLVNTEAYSQNPPMDVPVGWNMLSNRLRIHHTISILQWVVSWPHIYACACPTEAKLKLQIY